MKLKEPKIFSLKEAKGTLPLVSQIVADIVVTHERLVELDKQTPLLHDLQLRRESNQKKDALVKQLAEYKQELAQIGCHLREVSSGLIGYYWDRGDGLIVELSWKNGEQDICYWHELGDDTLQPVPQQ